MHYIRFCNDTNGTDFFKELFQSSSSGIKLLVGECEEPLSRHFWEEKIRKFSPKVHVKMGKFSISSRTKMSTCHVDVEYHKFFIPPINPRIIGYWDGKRSLFRVIIIGECRCIFSRFQLFGLLIKHKCFNILIQYLIQCHPYPWSYWNHRQGQLVPTGLDQVYNLFMSGTFDIDSITKLGLSVITFIKWDRVTHTSRILSPFLIPARCAAPSSRTALTC